MNEVLQLPKKYLLRWRFDYKDDKPTKRGMFNNSGPQNDLETKAWNKNTNVKFAIIEGKDIQTREIIVLAECLGEDFVNFEWIAAVDAFKKGVSAMICGLQIRTRDHVLKVFDTGETHLMARPKNDDKIHLNTFGK